MNAVNELVTLAVTEIILLTRVPDLTDSVQQAKCTVRGRRMVVSCESKIMSAVNLWRIETGDFPIIGRAKIGWDVT